VKTTQPRIGGWEENLKESTLHFNLRKQRFSRRRNFCDLILRPWKRRLRPNICTRHSFIVLTTTTPLHPAHKHVCCAPPTPLRQRLGSQQTTQHHVRLFLEPPTHRWPRTGPDCSTIDLNNFCRSPSSRSRSALDHKQSTYRRRHFVHSKSLRYSSSVCQSRPRTTSQQPSQVLSTSLVQDVPLQWV
jgi:hypothetical protein